MGCHFLLQRIILTQGSNLHLLHVLHCRQIIYLVSHQETFTQLGLEQAQQI